jgi:hypothetical protein
VCYTCFYMHLRDAEVTLSCLQTFLFPPSNEHLFCYSLKKAVLAKLEKLPCLYLICDRLYPSTSK